MLWNVWGGNGFRKAESNGEGSNGPDAVAGEDPVIRKGDDTPFMVSCPSVANGT
jgi:hypothetical protein